MGEIQTTVEEVPHHGIPICIQMEHFYNGVLLGSRMMLDASAGDSLLTKSYNEAHALIEGIAANNYQCPITRLACGKVNDVVGAHEVSEVSAPSAHMAWFP